MGSRAREEIVARFSPERTAAFVAERLADARARGAVTARASAYDARSPILEASGELAKKGMGDSLAQGRGSRPASFLRRLLQRALWPYLEDQRRFETAVLDALTVLHRSVEDLEQRIRRLEEPPTDVEQEPA